MPQRWIIKHIILQVGGHPPGTTWMRICNLFSLVVISGCSHSAADVPIRLEGPICGIFCAKLVWLELSGPNSLIRKNCSYSRVNMSNLNFYWFVWICTKGGLDLVTHSNTTQEKNRF